MCVQIQLVVRWMDRYLHALIGLVAMAMFAAFRALSCNEKMKIFMSHLLHILFTWLLIIDEIIV